MINPVFLFSGQWSLGMGGWNKFEEASGAITSKERE